MRNIVQFVETRESVRSFIVPDHFKFKPRGRMQFLQRWAWRFLQWRLALEQAYEDRSFFTRHTIDVDDVMQRLMKQRESAFAHGFDPKELLIGSEDFAEMMGSPRIHQAMEFHTEYSRDRRVMGLRVRVIPWMRGTLVMPREGA